MIAGLIMIMVAVWIHQSAMKAKAENVLMWVGICTAAFFVIQFALEYVNISILEAFRSSEGGSGYEDLKGMDRKNECDFLGFSGVLKSLYLELMPSIVSFLAVAVIRVKFITKEAFAVGTIFGGLRELFDSVIKSFKTATPPTPPAPPQE